MHHALTSFANKIAPPTPLDRVLSMAKTSMTMSTSHKIANKACNRI